jgi:glyoxylase-like metal-dependent hydrolase (beta-lactamase superfamily II)
MPVRDLGVSSGTITGQENIWGRGGSLDCRPMQLTDHVWLVGSGAAGFSTTQANDCHVYLVVDGDRAVMIDAGAGVDAEPLLAVMAGVGVAPDALDLVVLTHAHADHAGGAAELKQRLGLTVGASAEVAEILRNGDSNRASFDTMKGPGGYPQNYVYRPCQVDRELTVGERLRVGALELEVLATPGHSAGHLGFLLHRPGGTDLFSGDAAFGMGRVLLQDIWDCSIQQSTHTIRTLARLRPDGLFPGHGVIAVRDGWQHLYSAMSDIESGLPPRQLTF